MYECIIYNNMNMKIISYAKSNSFLASPNWQTISFHVTYSLMLELLSFGFYWGRKGDVCGNLWQEADHNRTLMNHRKPKTSFYIKIPYLSSFLRRPMTSNMQQVLMDQSALGHCANIHELTHILELIQQGQSMKHLNMLIETGHKLVLSFARQMVLKWSPLNDLYSNNNAHSSDTGFHKVLNYVC